MTFRKRLTSNRTLAITIGLVYLWFGALKYFPGLSPAEELAKSTIDSLTFGLIPSDVSIILLAIWETLIGLCLILNLKTRMVIRLALVHMAFTFTPLILDIELSFNHPPYGLTLVGQYIVKNVIIIAALIHILFAHATKDFKSGIS